MVFTDSIAVYAGKFFASTFLTAETYHYASNEEAAPHDRASRLADEILDKVHSNPKVFSDVGVILRQSPGHAHLGTHIQDTAKLYQIFLELQRLPAEARNWDVSDLAWRLVNSKLVATSVYQELTVKQTEAEKVSLLRDQLSVRGLLRPFLQILDVLPALKARLKETDSDAPVLTAGKIQSRANEVGSTAQKERKRYSTGVSRPERVSAPIEEHPVRNEGSSEWPTVPEVAHERQRPRTEVQKFAAPSSHFPSIPIEAHPKMPPNKEWETPAVAIATANKHRTSTEQGDKVRAKSSKSSKKGRRGGRDGSQKRKAEETPKSKTEVRSHKGRTVAMATTDSHGDPVAKDGTVTKDGAATSKGDLYPAPKPSKPSSRVGSSESGSKPASGMASEPQQESLGHGHDSLDLGHGGVRRSDSIPEQRRSHTEQIAVKKQRIVADSVSTSSSGSYHSTTDTILRPSSPLSPLTPPSQHMVLEHSETPPPAMETQPLVTPSPATMGTQPLVTPSPATMGTQPLETSSLATSKVHQLGLSSPASKKAQPQAIPSPTASGGQPPSLGQTLPSLSGHTSSTSTPSSSLPSPSTVSTSLSNSAERDVSMWNGVVYHT